MWDSTQALQSRKDKQYLVIRTLFSHLTLISTSAGIVYHCSEGRFALANRCFHWVHVSSPWASYIVYVSTESGNGVVRKTWNMPTYTALRSDRFIEQERIQWIWYMYLWTVYHISRVLCRNFYTKALYSPDEGWIMYTLCRLSALYIFSRNTCSLSFFLSLMQEYIFTYAL